MFKVETSEAKRWMNVERHFPSHPFQKDPLPLLSPLAEHPQWAEGSSRPASVPASQLLCRLSSSTLSVLMSFFALNNVIGKIHLQMVTFDLVFYCGDCFPQIVLQLIATVMR